MDKRYFVRDGNEIYNKDEVEQVEQWSSFEIERDVKRAITHMESKMGDAHLIIKVKVNDVSS